MLAIYLVEFDGSTKGSYQRVYTNIKDMHDDWVKYKEDLEKSFQYEINNFYPYLHEVNVEEQDSWFTLRIVNKDHTVGARQKVIFDEGGNLVKVSLKKLSPEDSRYIKNRNFVSKNSFQYKVTRGKVIVKSNN